MPGKSSPGRSFVVEVIGKEGSVRNERPRKAGSENVYVIRRGGGMLQAGSLESGSGRSDGGGGTG